MTFMMIIKIKKTVLFLHINSLIPQNVFTTK